MPRRKRKRWVFIDPPKFNKNKTVKISLDELEALRLADVEGLSQNEAAVVMGISQPTFHRILKNARKKVGIAVVYGFDVEITGGEHIMRKFRCFDCGNEWEEPFGTGRPLECPKCGSQNFCRVDRGRGMGKGRGGGKGGGMGRRW